MAGREEKAEWLKSSADPAYFLDTHTWIFNATLRSWVRFALWLAQMDVCDALLTGRHLIVLKARQLGLTWLCLGYALWLMLFRPAAVILLFSKREDEAQELMTRLQGMYQRLPFWMQCRRVETFLNAVKPTVDAGGQLALISTSDKSQPNSTFKRLFRAGWRGTNEYRAIFLPWTARPGRSPEWYVSIQRDMWEQKGTDDDLHQEYPETPEQALGARTLDKRLPPVFLQRVACEATPLPVDRWRADVPLVDGLLVYRLPTPGQLYVLGADPAEGNPTSDESALCVLDAVSGAQMAVCAGRFQPAVMAQKADQIGTFYNRADAMVERNNHGHAVLLWLSENGNLRLLPGLDGRPGWLSNAKGKALMYDAVVEGCRDGGLELYDSETIRQLGGLEGSSLRAPAGDHDDRADALALAFAGAGAAGMADQEPIVIRGVDPLQAMDRETF